MSQGILKKGLIAIVAIFIIIAVVWLFVVDWAVKFAIESKGSQAVGAKVDLANADLSLWPAGIELTGLKVTNPDKPMTNVVDVRRIYSDIELMPLIKGKVIIDNLRVQGIQVNTPRKTSGAIKTPGVTAGDNAPPLPPWLETMCATDDAVQLSIPKVSDILAREKLQALELAEKFKTRAETVQTQWRQRLEELPDRKDFEAYRVRLNKIKGSGGGLAALMGSAAEVTSLTNDLKKDMQRLKKAREDYQAEFDDLKKQSAQLVQAPMQEVRRLKAKYTISAEGIANMSRLLFGPSVCQWWKKGYHWYHRLKPYIGEMTAGKSSPAPEAPKAVPRKGELPDFLIRQLHVDAMLDTGSFTGEAADITSHPETWTNPTTFKFLGSQMKQVQNIGINGVLNLMQSGNPKTDIKMLIKNYALKDMALGDAGNLPLSISKALADINMDFNLTGSKLNALIKAQLEDVRMAVEDAAKSQLTGALAEAMASVTRFGLTALIKGNDPDYKAKIESDVDQVLSKAVGRIISQASARLETQLKTAIAEKTEAPLSEAQHQMGGLGELAGELTQRLNLGDNLLKEIKLPF